MDLTTVHEVSSALAGTFTEIAISTDPIDRIASVCLRRDSEYSACLESRMVDLAERDEIGQLSILKPSSCLKSSSEPLESLQLTGRLSLTRIFCKETHIGSVVAGVRLEDHAGLTIEVFCSSEICSLYLRLGGLHSSGEPEFERSTYDSVAVTQE